MRSPPALDRERRSLLRPPVGPSGRRKGPAKRTLGWSFVATIPVGLSFALLMVPDDPLSVFGWLAVALFVMGFAYGPIGGWLPSLFPARVRYTGVSVAFNAGGIIGGGLAPLAAQWLTAEGGLTAVGMCIAGAGLLSLAGLAITPRAAR